jgi:hypothetical protein
MPLNACYFHFPFRFIFIIIIIIIVYLTSLNLLATSFSLLSSAIVFFSEAQKARVAYQSLHGVKFAGKPLFLEYFINKQGMSSFLFVRLFEFTFFSNLPAAAVLGSVLTF